MIEATRVLRIKLKQLNWVITKEIFNVIEELEEVREGLELSHEIPNADGRTGNLKHLANLFHKHDLLCDLIATISNGQVDYTVNKLTGEVTDEQ
jgi:hypothetical protein